MLTEDLIAKTWDQIGRLYQQAKQMDERNSHIKSANFKYRDYFNPGLFNCVSILLEDYVAEIEYQFKDLLKANQAPQKNIAQIDLRGERLSRQITALIQAMKANEVAVKENRYRGSRYQKFNHQSTTKSSANQHKQNYSPHHSAAKLVMVNSHELHQELAQHHEYERRLQEMIDERQSTMNGLDSKSDSITNLQLQREILALHQRLGRCRQAISGIESSIEFAEKPNNKHFTKG